MEDRLNRLEDRLFRVREVLASAEPETAARLEGALRRLGELQVKGDLAGVVKLLESGQLDQAYEKQEELLEDLRLVLRLLAEQVSDPDQRRKELERLEAFRKELDQIIKEQQAHRQETRRVEGESEAKASSAGYPKMAADQRATGKRTGSLAQQMGGAPTPQDRSGQPQENQQGQPAGPQDQKDDHRGPDSQPASAPASEPTPGQPQVAEAQKHMGEAAKDLDGKEASEAGKDQDKALEQLEAAKAELQEAIQQKRREQQEELLRDLRERFSAMLRRQEQINGQTIALDKMGTGNWRRSEELQMAALSKEQHGVGDEAMRALGLLKEDASTAVFPRVVEAMAEDMYVVSDWLGAGNVDVHTQQIQRGIVETLKELLAAIEQKQKEGAGGGDSGEGGQGGPLLPGSAELKLLRSMQMRLNMQTTELEKTGPKDRSTFEKLSRRQAEVADMAREMHERTLNRGR